MDKPQEKRPEKGPKAPLEEAPKEDLVKQVKRQLGLLQKAKAKYDELNQKCLEKDKALSELQSQAEKWAQDQVELETLRQAYQSLQGAQEKQFESFRVLEEQLAASNEDLVRWRHKYTECLMSLECTESKLASYTQGTEFLQQEVQRLEAENRAANAKVAELSAVRQQQLEERDRRHEADSEAAFSQGHLKQKVEELLAQCSSLRQERDACGAAREALAQQAESAREEADALRLKVSVLLQERSSLENQRDEKMNECNLLQEEKHGLESQVSDLYQMKEELEAKEKEFAKILDDHANMEKLLAEAITENTQLQERVNGLQEKVSRGDVEKQELARQLESAADSLREQTQSSERAVAELEEKLAQQMNKQKELEHQLAVSESRLRDSEKRADDLKASLAQQPSSSEDDAAALRLQELLCDQAALKEEVEVLKREKECLVVTNLELEEAAENVQSEKKALEEELATVRAADVDLLQKLETFADKVGGLEKDLSDSLQEKQDIVDELIQVKDLQSFLEDEAKELQQECDKLKIKTARLEADLENDRLHIQKLEIELEAAEGREQQSLRELEAMRQKLKEMAVLAMKYEEAFKDCSVGNAESRMPAVLKAFHRISQIILETAERNVVDIQVEGLLPGMGATLVLDDCDGECEELWGQPAPAHESLVSLEAYNSLKNEIETVQKQLLASTDTIKNLQAENQALEENLSVERRGRDLLTSELKTCEGLLRSYERKIEELDSCLCAKISDLTGRVEENEEMLRERSEALRGALQDIVEVSEGCPELKDEQTTLLSKVHQLEDISSATAVDTAAQLSASLEGQQCVDGQPQELEEVRGPAELLVSPNCADDLKPTEQQSPSCTSNFKPMKKGEEVPESPRSHGSLTNQDVLHGTHHCVDDDRDELGRLQEENDSLIEECSSLRASLESSKAAVAKLSSNLSASNEEKKLLEESFSREVSALKAKLQEKACLLDDIHSKLDDQLEQCEKLEAMLKDRDNNVQTYQDELAKKDSELATLTEALRCLKEQLSSYEVEHTRLCAVFQPQTRHEDDNLKEDVLYDWYSAHRAVLSLLAQLVAHASKQQRLPSDGNGDFSVLSEARCLCATLTEKLDAVTCQEATSSISCAITKAICSDVRAELALVKSLDQLLESLLAEETKAGGEEVPPSEPDDEEKQNDAVQIATLQSTLQEREERLAKYKVLIIKHKKEMADKTKLMSSMERDLLDTKHELEKLGQASQQAMLNFQGLQSDYDHLQDQHEATKSLCKEAEAKLAGLAGERAAARQEAADARAERDLLKQRNELLATDLAVAQQCRSSLEARLAALEAQARLAEEREERHTGHVDMLQKSLEDTSRKLVAAQEALAGVTRELEEHKKESKMHTLLDLEIADYERTVAELNNLLKERSGELENTRKESLAYQSKITSLVEHIGYLESQKKADDERMLAFKETVANLKEGLSRSRKHEEDLLQSEVRLESELKAAQLREQDLKLGYAEVSKKCQELESTFRTTKDNYQRAIKALESKVASLKEELETSRGELQATKVEFDNYKVRVHTVLKQQKKGTVGGVESAETPSEAQEKLQGAMEQMRQKVRDLTEQLQLSRSEAEASRDEYDRLAQRHQAIALELEAREAQWKRRLEDVIKQNSADMSVELDRQLQKQYEELSAKYQKKLAIQEQQHSKALELHVDTVEQLKREIAELQQRLPTRQGSPPHDETIDITTLERQDGEGSESVSPVPPVIAKLSPWSLVPSGGFKPLEQLLHEDEDLVVAEDLDALHTKITDSQKKVDHLAELLNESESSNLRMTEQIRVLKEEIRRLERNQEREKHAQNLEYLKNVIMKFVTLRGGSEKERLVPVLTTMLKLSPEEKKDLEAVVTGEAQQEAAAASSWGGYLPRW